MLVVGLLALVFSAQQQLEAQRRLRHRVVAERIFDEIERGISDVLWHEATRPSDAYDAIRTDPDVWWPFVVGYYRKQDGVTIVAEGQLDAARIARVRGAVRATEDVTPRPLTPTTSLPAAKALQDGRASTPDVLRQLNQGVSVRGRRQQGLAVQLSVYAVNDETLVFERPSQSFGRFEGLVIDVPGLVSTVHEQVIAQRGLEAVLILDRRVHELGRSAYSPLPGASSQKTVSTLPGDYVFTHRLAVPFERETLRLSMARFDDEDAGGVLLGLGALVLLSVLAGLFALYRMVETRLRFAAQQDDFVSAVTHELKTPLTAIRMAGEMLRDDMVETDADRKGYYELITAEGERLSRLIHNVLEHGKLRRGQRRSKRVPRALAPLLSDALRLMGPQLEQAGFQVEVHVAEGVPPVWVDVDALKQVLYNLLENALKYGAAPEQKRISITVLSTPEGVELSVRDYGAGVHRDQLAMLFKPFVRGEREMTRTAQGTGLGLSLVRELIELMGGRVAARNCDPGFEVRLTLLAAEATV